MKLQWKGFVLSICLIFSYTIYLSVFRLPVAPEIKMPSIQPVKPAEPYVYKPKKVFPKEWYEVPNTAPDATCPEKTNIYFLRTHQTGTSSIVNIFYRFGQMRGLNFVLYPLKMHLGYPAPMNVKYLEHIGSAEGYNIMTQHVRHNSLAAFRIMPEGTMFTTLLRNPVAQFLSVFHNHDIKSEIKYLQAKHDPIDIFFEDPQKFAMSSSDRIYHLLQNSMAFDLGLDPKWHNDPDKVNTFIADLDKEFHFVLILEQLDESLVLLRRLMCWKLDDILYVRLSVNNEYSRKVDPKIEAAILEWNKVDLQLYNHFADKMKKILAQQGPDFQREVAEFKALNRQFFSECYSRAMPVYNFNKVGYMLNEGKTKNITCKQLATDDATHTHIMSLKQFGANIAPSDVLMVRNHVNNLNKMNRAMLTWQEVAYLIKNPKDRQPMNNELK